MRKGILLAAALLLGGFVPPAGAQDADTPLDRALQKVEALLTALRANPAADPAVVKSLEDIAASLREAKGVKDGEPPGGATLPPGVDENLFRFTLETFLQGVDLKDDPRAAAEQILREFVSDYGLARRHEDDKSKAVVRDHTERRIGLTFVPRDANRLKDNLDTIIRRWDWTGGRRGR